MRTRRPSALVALLALVIGPLILDATAQGTPEGEMVLAWHVTIAPAWFDPADSGSNQPLEKHGNPNALTLDIFSPIRQDWLNGTDDYFRR